MSVIKTGTTSTTGYIVESDTNGNLVIQTGSTPTTALTLNSDQTATFAQSVNIPNTFGFKNRIINGGMVIDQRNAGASVTPTNGQYTLDRWQAIISQTSKFTVQQNAGAVTRPVGFTNYLGLTSSSTYSVLTGDYFALYQGIEGFNCADLGWGTANAQPVTLSFWVRSSLTGTFGGSLKNNSTRSYPFTYTISSANTWEYKTITVVGDTTGTWDTNNSLGMYVSFGLGVGSTFSGTAGAWAGSNFVSATGATSVVGTNGATFYITGVQLERGSTATSFDFRPYGTELMLCQRYYYKVTTYPLGYSISAGDLYAGQIKLPVTMRSAPSGDAGATFQVSSGNAGTVNIVNTSGGATTVDAVNFSNAASNWTTNVRVGVSIGLTAEL